jgi:type 1 glutamine amidotransferase
MQRFSVFLLIMACAVQARAVDTQLMSPTDPMLPDGHAIAAQLHCGEETASPAGESPAITVTRGESLRFEGVNGPLGIAASDAKQVEVTLSGLREDADYVLGFTWWDADNSGRIQSVKFARGGEWETVLPAMNAVAYFADEPTYARIQVPVPKDYREDGSVRAAFVREAGPNAVVNEIWLLERRDPAARKRIVIVTCDDWPGHRWRETAPAYAALLREAPGVEVSICESPAIFGSPMMAHYDAALIHFKNYDKRLPLSPAIWDGLARYAAGGGGIVIAHYGCGAFEEWDDYVKLAGRIWEVDTRQHDPYGAFTVRVIDTDHPVTQGLGDFDTEDELYTCLKGETPVRVLCEATSKVDHVEYPMAFVVEGTGGRVLHCTLGHDVNSLSQPGARAFYRRALLWAATRD